MVVSLQTPGFLWPYIWVWWWWSCIVIIVEVYKSLWLNGGCHQSMCWVSCCYSSSTVQYCISFRDLLRAAILKKKRSSCFASFGAAPSKRASGNYLSLCSVSSGAQRTRNVWCSVSSEHIQYIFRASSLPGARVLRCFRKRRNVLHLFRKRASSLPERRACFVASSKRSMCFIYSEEVLRLFRSARASLLPASAEMCFISSRRVLRCFRKRRNVLHLFPKSASSLPERSARAPFLPQRILLVC